MTVDDIKTLQHAAENALSRAYAPYSGFPVGAAVMTFSRDIFVGCNVENAAYPLGLCAEAGALSALVVQRGFVRVQALFVVVEGAERAWPCGACRQRLQEFAAPETMVYAARLGGAWACLPFARLLPASFGPHNLAIGPHTSGLPEKGE